MSSNHFLSFAAAALVCMSLSSGAQAVRSRIAPQKKFASVAAPRINLAKEARLNARHANRMNAPSVGWEPLGEGWYHDELFISYGMPAEEWKVAIEHNTQSSGWYRFIPYNENSSVADLLGYPDDQYMYVNAKNPNKVYAEDITVYGSFLFSNVVVENDWDDAYQYARLVDGVITWPSVNTFASYDNGWFYCQGETGVAIYLPGSDYKDYSMDILTEHYCSDSNTHDILITSGADVASFKYLSLPGNHSVADEADAVVAQGIAAPNDGNGAFITVDLSDREPGIYTTMIAALDDKGNVRASKQTHFIVPDNSIEWVELGQTSFNEPLYYGVYDDFKNEPLAASLYEAAHKPGLYLLDNPYASHSELGSELSDSHSHNHGIMVDASNPERVIVLPSSVGVTYDGDGAAWSLADYYLQAGMDEETVAAKGFFGKKSENADGSHTVEMPYGTLMIGEKNYYAGEFIDCDAPFSFIVPAKGTDAISSIEADASRTQVFNLQGIRVPSDTKGAVIVKKGSKIIKQIAR